MKLDYQPLFGNMSLCSSSWVGTKTEHERVVESKLVLVKMQTHIYYQIKLKNKSFFIFLSHCKINTFIN